METVRTGSTRIMTAVEPGVIALQYTDRWSAFDRGSSPQIIPTIGRSRCACAVKSFEIARDHGLRTHFVRQVDPETIHVMEFSVPGRESLSGKVHGRVIPLEWIWRARAKGSLLERLAKGEITPEQLGFPPGTVVTDGMELPRMLFECTTKFEHVDRHLSNAEARSLGELSDLDFAQAELLIEKAVGVTNSHYDNVGIESPDGKLELGMLLDGSIILVDVYGTQDENRLLTSSGTIMSKDIIRNYLKTLPWKKELDAAKKAYPTDKSKWPPYPELTADLVELVSARYAEVARRYAGV